MEFRKGGQLPRNQAWTYNGQTIDIVENFNYLGFVMSSGGSFRKGIDALADKALMFSLKSITRGTITYKLYPF
jgi:hypothetical protein